MAVKFIPRPYQREMIHKVINNPRCALFAGMGLGKTASTLTAIEAMRLAGDITGRVLVIAPKRVALTTWIDEVTKWEHTKHLVIRPIIGTPKEREAAVRDDSADIHTINYENLPWLLKTIGKNNWDYEMIVADESTKLKSFRLRQGSKRARSLASVAFKSPRFVNLTGTPNPNGLADLWGQTWFIDGGARLGRSFQAFKDRWFQMSFDGFSIKPLPHAQEEIESRIKDICFSWEAEDHFNIDTPIETTVHVELPPKVRRMYNDMEKTMWAELSEEDNIRAVNAAAKTMKCLQIANGAAYLEGDGNPWTELHDEKIKALEEIINETGEPVLVSYYFASDLERLTAHFKNARVLDSNPDTIRDWNAGKIPILFAHPASAGHGLNLQHGGRTLVFFSVNWNLEHHQQIIERIGTTRQAQAGYDRAVFIYYIQAKNTVEHVVMQRLETKATVQDALMQAMKERNQ